MNTVYIVKCANYEQAEQKITDLLDMLGGIEQFAAPGEQIALKVNLLMPAKPEQAITTHPAIATAVGKLAKQAGAIPVIVDSPGGGHKHTRKELDTLYRTCGMYQAAEAAGIEASLDTTHEVVSFPEGKLIKRIEVISPVHEADGVINLCKLKTHVFMHMTGAVKNTFGVIPGLSKPGYHAKLADTGHFANMLLDLAAYVKPRLSIMDAVIGLEGDGPGTGGTPRQVGLLLASVNPLALDVAAGEIMGIPRSQNPVLLEAEKRGLAPTTINEIELIGAEIQDLRIPDYKLPTTIFEGTGFGLLNWWHKLLLPLFKTGLSTMPSVITEKCIACGICRDSCPKGVITIEQNGRKYAKIHPQECIRCYCCHELCPQEAIELKQSMLYRFMNRA
jgi:uncharacterized protein (DUF362 family)/NAD-dependent dihydropyrimidine dehydrogenase PreA subunit